uniref:CHK domain-containing protein n=1 Tax=Strongyloides stercoralis TaxID=6248 RepID=A0A0K0DSQ5_STRER
MDEDKILSLLSDPSIVDNFSIENVNITFLCIVKILYNNSIKFKNIFSDGIKIDNFDIKQIGEGKGFVSYVYRISISFTNNQEFSFILKFPTSKILNEGIDIENGEVEFITNEEVSTFHNNECLFYSLFSDISNFKIPKVYYTQSYRIGSQDGLILLEDLSNTSTHIECYKTFNIHQVKNIFKQISILQIISLILKDKEVFHKFNRVINDNDFLFFLQFAFEHWNKLTKILPDGFYKHLEGDLKILISHWRDISILNCYRYEENQSNPVVFAHSDIWNNNILFSIDEDGNPSNKVEALIDWQLLQVHSTGNDFSKLLIYCTDPYIRKEAEKTLLKYFYNHLKGNILKNNIPFTMTFDIFMKNYKYSFIENALMFLMSIGFSLKGYDMPDDLGDPVWDARKLNIAIRIVSNVSDAISYTKELKPEWFQKE